MKKTFAYALLVLTALYSCEEGKQEEPVLPGTTPDEIYLNVSPHTLTFDETDASKNIITVSTNTNWKATVDNSELKINRTEGTYAFFSWCRSWILRKREKDTAK